MRSWPNANALARSAWLAAAFLALFACVYGGTDALTGLHGFRVHVHLPFEPRIPFVPELAGLYLSLAAMFALAPFVLHGWREQVPLVLTLGAETLLAGVFFLVLPVELGFPALPPDTGRVFALADWLNLDHNAVPSLHVAFAATLAELYGRHVPARARAALRLWAAGIATAAVLIHAHHLLDVATGALLAAGAVAWIHPRMRAPARLDALQIEWICLREFAHFSRRHLRYAALFAVMYGRCLPRWTRTRAVRAGYCLLQHLDDVADGDRAVGMDPGAYLARSLDEIARERFSRSSVASVLAAHLVPALRARASGAADPLRDLRDLIEILAFDRERAARARVLAEAELRAHHRRTFELSLSLTLVASESDLTPKDAEGLIDALSWCSPMRDLAEDLGRGLINVPSEVLAAAGIACPDGETASHPALRAWIRSEYERGAAAIAAFERSLPRLAGRPGATALVLLHRALASFARRYERGLP